jgi:hypothetical protein
MNAVAQSRHKRVTNARRLPKIPKAVVVSAPFAVVATAATVTAGVVSGTPLSDPTLADGQQSIADLTSDRGDEVSRDSSRVTPQEKAEAAARARKELRAKQAAAARARVAAATAKAINQAHIHQWATTDLNIWSGARAGATQLGEIAEGDKVLVTGREARGRTEVVINGKSRWVTSGYLSDEKPIAAAAGLSMEPCPDSSVESGLTDGAIYVYRSVCHAFPQITTYLGWDDHGEHSSGKALDIMISDPALGDAVAAFLQEHAAELNIYDIIWQQHIWTPERASEGWRYMEDRGSTTANHYDHVHVSVY